MTTALTIINRAYALLGYKAAGEALSGDDAQAGLDALNVLIDSWNTQPLLVSLAFPLVAFDAITTSQSLAPACQRALELTLVAELSPGLKPVDAFILQQAEAARRAYRRTNVVVLQMSSIVHHPFSGVL